MQRRSTSGVVKENVSDFVNVNIAGKEAKVCFFFLKKKKNYFLFFLLS